LDDPKGSNANCGDKTLISGLRSYAWTVRATNYGRWCWWWLQSNRIRPVMF